MQGKERKKENKDILPVATFGFDIGAASFLTSFTFLPKESHNQLT
jgi:hypothetical protein